MASKNIFGKPGIAVDSTREEVPALLEMKVNGASESAQLLLLDIQGAAEGNVQVDRTFDEQIFVTSFGQRLSQWTISGFAPRNLCDNVQEGKQSGKIISKFYDKYNAGDNGPIEVGLSFDGIAITGILLGMGIGPYRVQEADAYRYTLHILGSKSK
jgi:hypothetical protein